MVISRRNSRSARSTDGIAGSDRSDADFPDEEIDFLEAANAFGRLDRLQVRLAAVLRRAQQGRLLQDGLQS